MRVGISTGDATLEHGDYFGEPVVEAARLCAVAHGGQILTTDVVKALARRSGHSFSTERELELKGLPEPVVVWEVVWEPAEDAEGEGTTEIPLPPRLPQVPGIGVVGREAELDRLKEALKAVTEGEPVRIVLISGEAGLGKSTLASSLARDAHRDGAVVLYGRCDENMMVPHLPFVEALSYYLAHTNDGVLSTLGDERLTALSALVPDLRIRLPELVAAATSDPDAERWILYGAVVALLERVSADAPVVLILDDLHWTDRPSAQLLQHIARNLEGRVLILGTYRDAELSSSHPLTGTLASLTREHSPIRLSLSGLEDDEVVAFVEAAAGQQLDDAGIGLAHALYQETDGNPFYMSEVLRHLVETRSIVQDDTGRWIPTQELVDAGLPDSVRQVIGSRVGRLGEEAGRVLAAASVLGQEFDVELLARVVDSTEDRVVDALEAAGSSTLVAEVRGTTGRFRFTHALIQRTLYDDLGGTRRSRLHRAAAEALEERLGDHPGDRAGELARHWLAATRPQESSKAISYARLAGESALESLAPAEAIRWYGEALNVLTQAPDDRERAQCLVGLGEAQRQLGEAAYRETLLEAARISHAIGDIDTLVRAALANNRGFVSAIGEVDTERVGVLEIALKAAGPENTTVRARLLALLASERTFDGDELARRALADEALSVARDVGDPATVLDVLLRRVIALWVPETVEQMLIELAEAEVLAEQMVDPVGKYWSAGFHAVFSIQVGDVDEVIRCHDDAARLASEVGQPILKWCAAFSRSWSTLLSGDMAGSEALASEALQIGSDTGQPDALAFYGVQLFAMRWQQGRLGEIVDFMAQVAAENPGLPMYRGLAAFALAESGRDGDARRMLSSEVNSRFSAPHDYLLNPYLSYWARVTSYLGDKDAAEALYGRLADWGHLTSFTGAIVLGAVAHDLATLATVLGRYDEAEEHFTHALEIHEKLAAPFFIADTQFQWGRMLLARRARSDLSRAEEMLHAARDTAERYGFSAVEGRAVEALAMLS